MTLDSMIKKRWQKLGLLYRLLLGVGIVIIAGSAIQTHFLMRNNIVNYQKSQHSEIQEVIELLTPVISEQAIIGDYASITQLMNAQVEKRKNIGRLYWMDEYDSLIISRNVVVPVNSPKWFARWVNLPIQDVTSELILGGVHYGDLRVQTTPNQAINELWTQLQIISTSVVVVLFFVFILLAIFVRSSLQSMQDLSIAADRFSKLEHNIQIDTENAPPEVQNAVNAFNNMARRIEKLLSDLSSARRDILEQLHFNEELFNALPNPVFYKDRHGLYMGVNKAWEDFFRLKEEDVLGRLDVELFPSDQDNIRLHNETDESLWHDLNIKSYETEIHLDNSHSTQAMYSKAALTNAKGEITGLIGIITDLSELKNAEQQAEEAIIEKVNAISASKAKSAFLANMSHEIRTPLTAIIGFSESLMDTHLTDKERTEAIQTVIKAGKHLLQLINDILDLSKIEAGKIEIEPLTVKPVNLIEDIRHLVQNTAVNKGLDFNINYHFPIPEGILTDPVRLKQILLNLTNNAIKFTKQGYVQLDISYKADTRALIFEVSDTGVGINPEQVSKLFSAFTQADSSTTREFGGTGLGLYLSQQLASALGGKISIQSQPQVGSEFTLILQPVKLATPHLIYERRDLHLDQFIPESHNVKQTSHGRILIAEDNEHNQSLISIYLKNLGLETSIAENGQIAVDKALSEDYDLILMDMQMPVLDGLQATKQLRKRHYNGPIIALTANTMKEDIDECFQAGCNAFLSKPIDREAFNATILKFLNTNRSEQGIDDNPPIQSKLLEDDPGMLQLIQLFTENLDTTVTEIRASFDIGQYDACQFKLHSLKDVSGNYGYPQLAALLEQMEQHLDAGQPDKLPALFDQLDQMTRIIIHSIQAA